MNERLKVFSGNANKALAEEICEVLHVPLGEAEIGRAMDDRLLAAVAARGRVLVVLHRILRKQLKVRRT